MEDDKKQMDNNTKDHVNHDAHHHEQNANHETNNQNNNNHNEHDYHGNHHNEHKNVSNISNSNCNSKEHSKEGQRVSEVDELKNKITQLESELASTKDKALRTLADCENTKKRLQREKDEAVSYANKAILKDLLPSLDSLDLAISTTKDEDIKKGIELVRTTFLTALKKWGLEVIDDKGKEYDPNRHEACLFEVNPEASEETVLETLQKGYTLHSIVIRPSKVKVEKCE